MGAIRVLHCPNAVGGNPCGLARAERDLGLESWCVSFSQNPYGYEADEILFGRNSGPFRREAKRWQLLLRALKDFDVIHFNFGRTIMPQSAAGSTAAQRGTPVRVLDVRKGVFQCYARLFEMRDLSMLKRAGKRIIMTYQGDDARQGDFCLANFEINPAMETEPGYYSPESDAQKRQKIARLSRYADRIYALNPDLLWVLPPQAQFLPYSHIDLTDWRPVDDRRPAQEVPVVLHAPSHRGVKGTRFILDAASRLRAEGIPFELVLVEGIPHQKARRLYERADLVVDQLLCGWYGGFAVEAMALGKPVISYIREQDMKFIPQKMREEMPIIGATPATICAVLKELLTERKHELLEIGRRGRAYVEKWHDPRKIAASLKDEYEALTLEEQQRRQH